MKIWGYALPGPRVIEVSLVEHRNQPGEVTKKFQATKPTASFLTSFHTCHGSRTTALKQYPLSFQNDILPLSSYETASKFFHHRSRKRLANKKLIGDKKLIQRLTVNGGTRFFNCLNHPDFQGLRDLFISEYLLSMQRFHGVAGTFQKPKYTCSLFGRKWQVVIPGLRKCKRWRCRGEWR